MRVTNSMLVNTLIRNLNVNMGRLDKLQGQLSTGRKFAHISDDPVALVYSQQARNKIARLSHYQKSVGSAQDWLNQAEVGVMDLQETIKNAIETAVDAATDVKTDEDRQNLARTMEEYRRHFVDTLNTTFGDKFAFGGYNTPGDPTSGRQLLGDGIKSFVFDPDVGEFGTLYYNGFDLSQLDGMDNRVYEALINADTLADFNTALGTIPPPLAKPVPVWTPDEFDRFQTLKNDILTFDVGPGIDMPVTMNGVQLVLYNTTRVNADGQTENVIRNMANVLHEMFLLAEDGSLLVPPSETSAKEIGEMIKPLQDAQNHLLTKTAEIGGRVRRLELLEARYEQDEINYKQMKSDAEDVDAADTIMYLKMAEAVYQAALSAGARIIQPTLMDFLR